MGSLDEAYLDITEYVSKRSQRVRLPRVRYSGDCLCRLPRVLDSDKDQLDSATTSEAFCEKCGRKRIRVDDFVCFGTEVDQIVSEMRFRVEQLTGLTCSAGIAPNSMIAKVCSDFNKPNGQFRIENDRQSVMEFMQELPLRKVSGIGAVTEAILKGIGIEKCGELYEKRAVLSLLFTRCSLEHFLRIALGISVSYTAQNTSSKRKSISVERTFHPTADLHLLIKILEDLCNDLIDSLLEHHIRGGYSATVKCKFSTFDVITRCVSVDYLLNEKNALFKICEKIVRNEIKQHNHLHIRLLGVRLSRLIFVDDKVDKVKSLTSFWSTSDTNEQSTMNNANGGVTLDKQKPLNDGMETNQEKIHESDERHSNDAKTDASVSISKAALSTQPCPVCGDQLPDQLAMVNRHLDECLNRYFSLQSFHQILIRSLFHEII
ncbi:unnamed protein product [Anisakis simplex]|uniref:DNA-directed DNA polymerase n=1 Tax=Anisakis simplex TaxID=6269 RepID=A0A0M3JVI5_ANISI|nr:unnamed protein product [Anisakis simplex]